MALDFAERWDSTVDVESLVRNGLRQLRQNINSLDPLVIKKLETYLSERYRRAVTIVHDNSNVRVDVVVQYVDIKEVAINMAPFILPVDIIEPDQSFQETRLNFNRIDISEAEQRQCAMHVWQQLEYKDKIAFCLREIEKMRKADLATLAGVDGLVAKGKINQADAEGFRKDATERLKTVERVKQSIEEGKVEMILNAGDASILVKAKK